MSNFGVLFLFGTIILVIYMIAKNKNKQSNYQPNYYTSDIPKDKPVNLDSNNYLYKQKEIKQFDINGMSYQNLNPNLNKGKFIGVAISTPNNHDQYCISIFNEVDKLIGYIPKGNKRLQNSLKEWNNGKVMVWGYCNFDDYNNNWQGSVYIPVGISYEEELLLKSFFISETKLYDLIKKSEKNTEGYFHILHKYKECKEILNQINKNFKVDLYFPNNIAPSISKHLEAEKNWEKLIELGEYNDLISQLSEKFKEKTLQRIELAKEKLT